MYIPKHFAVTDQNVIVDFIRRNAFGQLVSIEQRKEPGPGRPDSSYLPFLINDNCTSLTAHMARQNPQWQELHGQEVMITFLGPHAYVSPSWYKTPGVPTWNYQVVNVYGKLKCFSGNSKLAQTVNSLTEMYESTFAEPWQAEYSETMLRAIVGIEIEITELQAKFKMSQNRSTADQAEVIRQLREGGSEALAVAMEKNK